MLTHHLQEDIYTCIQSGSYSQNNSKFIPHNNKQCVCISVCACTVAQYICRSFSSETINNVIDEGHKYYVETKIRLGSSHIYNYLNPDELMNSTLSFLNIPYAITTEWVHNGFYPLVSEEKYNSVNDLAAVIEQNFEIDSSLCFVFVGLNAAVSFWKFEEKYHLFNSHSVDHRGNTVEDGVGRLFISETARGLASLLLINAPLNNNPQQYEIQKVIAKPLNRTESNLHNLNDPKLSRRCVVVLTDISPTPLKRKADVLSKSDCAANKAGRPPKRKQGRPKLSTLTAEELHHEYSDQNPQVNHNKNQGLHLPTQMRKGELIGQYQGDQLKRVKAYRLRNVSLKSDECFKCPHCNASLFDEEKNRKQWCCGRGRFNVLNLPPLNESFYRNDNFLKNSRLYNDMFSFCAFHVKGGFHHPTGGVSFIKIKGRTYHTINHLSYRNPTNNLNKGSLYIHDEGAMLHCSDKSGLDRNIIKGIHQYLQKCNKYISDYKRLYDQESDNAKLVFECTNRRTHGPNLGDRPTCNEIAAIISTDIESRSPRELVVWKIGDNRPTAMYYFHALVEPFQYPLLYPHGTTGWYIGRTDNRGNKLSQLSYVRCLLLSESRFSTFGRLSETWLVDMFARIDEERLNFLRYAQIKGAQQGGVRIGPADEVSGVVNGVTGNVGNQVVNDIRNDETIQGEGNVIPGRVYLNSRYTGGPRYMQRCYYDAMSLVSRLGSPSFFLTFTAYAGWEEIKKSRHHSNYNDPSVVNRVFQIKLLELLRDIRCGKFFGKLTYIVWVIEFQKRGLPHAHICFKVDSGPPVQNTDIDRFIRADIPTNAEPEQRLRMLVLKHMIHGPCDRVNSNKRFICRDADGNNCSKFFPKPHRDTTFIDDRGFVHYKRNSLNTAIISNNIEVNDCWVVPYNAALLLKYECHINLELCSAQRVVKYLFKYISKGSPLQRVTIIQGAENNKDDNDEIEEYVTKRYVGSSDAAWRVLEFDITGREPSVRSLVVHLEGKQSVLFIPGREKQALENSSSDLILYLNRPKLPSMDSVTYQGFFENFLIHTSKPNSKIGEIIPHPDKRHFITPRKRGKSVARIEWISPRCGELYYLRILLLRYPCRGYSDLYNLGGPECSSFQEAARCLGLAHNSREYHEAMQEACEFMLPYRFRQFFVLLITNGAIAIDLWNQFKDSLCDDYLVEFPNDTERALKLGLIQIDRCLRRHGSSNYEAGLPVVQDFTTELGREKLQYSISIQLEIVNTWESKLSADQLEVLHYVRSLIDSPTTVALPRSIFLNAPGGYGKTLLLSVIAAYIRSLSKVVLCVATSGIAAQNLPGGVTAHSMFKLPLDLGDGTCYWSVTNGSQRAELIREASLIIFDEAPMAHKHIVECLNRSLQDLMNSSELFGGKIVIFAGDFRQIPPVVEYAKTPSEVINVSLRRSHIIWPKLKQFKLTTPHRTGSDNDYAKFLLDIGSNNVKQCSVGVTKETVVALDKVCHVDSLQSLIEFVFPDDIIRKPDECAKRAIISTHNINVTEINDRVIQLIEGDFEELFSHDSIAEDDGTGLIIDETTLHQAQGKNVPSHVIRLKVGAVCIIVRNLSFDQGLVNGTKVIITAISHRLVTVRKPGCDEHFGIPRISFKFPIFPRNPVEILRRQFPLQLCYAISVHKSQGQTIERLGLDLRSDCFTHGQLYVGLSRVRSSQNIRVLVSKDRIINGIAYSKNVVYGELLS